jgi:uncharacterized Zn finger protein (UPF0148 family)
MTKEKEIEDKVEHEFRCKYCGLPMDEHDGSDFCPPGTEEFGGRR